MTGSVPLLALTAPTLVACGASSATSSSSGSPPTVLTTQQVEARTQGHPSVLLFTAQCCASRVGEAKALQDAAGSRKDLRQVGVDMFPHPSGAGGIRAGDRSPIQRLSLDGRRRQLAGPPLWHHQPQLARLPRQLRAGEVRQPGPSGRGHLKLH